MFRLAATNTRTKRKEKFVEVNTWRGHYGGRKNEKEYIGKYGRESYTEWNRNKKEATNNSDELEVRRISMYIDRKIGR